MADLISRAVAIEAAFKGADDWDGGFNPKYLNELPAVDAVPVVHGRWVYEDGDPATIPCSVCNYRVMRYNNTKYCPNCGAKMDKEGE